MRRPLAGLNRRGRGAGAGLALFLSSAFSLRALSWLLLLVTVAHGLNFPLAAVIASRGPRPASAESPAGRAKSAKQAAETFTIYGPRRFERAAGAPATVTERFTLPADATAPFKVSLQNGTADGAGRVSSATVRLNGADLFRQNDFSNNVVTLSRDVTLGTDNTLEVRLTSAVGSHITITVTATRTQAQPAALTSVEPQRAMQGQSLSVVLGGRNTHWAQGQTRASFGGEISVGGAAPGEAGPILVSDATTAIAELVVSPTAALAPRAVRIVTRLQGGAEEESVSLLNALTVVAVNAPGSSASRVATLAGAAGAAGFADGDAADARFNGLAGVAIGADDAIYVADAGNHRVRVVRGQTAPAGATSYTVSTLAGSGAAGFADGPAASAQFNNPQGVAVDAGGVLYVADTDNHRIRRVAPDGTVSTLAGDGTPGFVNGPAAQARFNAPRGVAADNSGNVYVADSGNSAVRRITPAGEVSTVAGDGTVGSSDSPAARFDNLSGIACDGEHVFVYLGDTGNHRIRRLDSGNTVITLAGAERGFADGSADQARFAEPSGLALDGAGKIVVADAVNSLVRQVDPGLAAVGSPQAVTTLAGTGERGGADGAGNVARFFTPRGVAVSASSAVVVADTGNNTLRRVLLPPVIVSLSPQRARAAEQISLLGERFDARAPERNAVKFTRSVAAGGGQTSARVLSATRTALTVEVPSDAADGPVTVQTEGGSATSPVDFQLEPFPAPSITDFDPKRGPSGTSVTLSGSGLKAGAADPSVTFQGANGTRLPALVTFSSLTQVRALVPNAAVTGHIELTTLGGRALSPSPFVVDSEQDFRLTVSPSSATAVQGGTAVYVVSVSSDQPTFSQMAALSATGLPSGVRADFAPPQITAGATSTLSVATGGAGLAPGSYPFTVEAVAQADGRQLSRAVPATLNVLAGGQTTLSGRVLSTEDEPIIGATVSLDGRTATTDAAGAFLLSGVTAGPARPLMVDGRTASAPNRTYPVILEPADIAAGQANVVPYTFYLPPIDTQYEVDIIPGQNTAAGNPRVPGLQMIVPAGANLRNRDNSPVARVSITPLAIDRTPTPLPSGVKTNLVYTSQPGGAVTDLAIPVIYPNLAGADPGTRVELYAFDHDLVRWYVYGFGRVSTDGRTIAPETDPATGRPYGLRDFSWHFPNAGPGGNPGPNDPCNKGSHPVDFTTGMKIEKKTDVAFGGARGGLELTRIYTSDLAQTCDFCPFGRGWTHNYAVRLTGNFQQGGAGRIVMPGESTGQLFSYVRADADGSLLFATTATVGQLGDVVRRLPNGTLEYLDADGRLMRFGSSGRLTSVADRNGNTTTLTYTGASLTRVTDAAGRSITLEYDFAGRVTRATDPLGRAWRYTYEGTPGVAGNPGLTTVTDPLTGVTRYQYVAGGRLSAVTDPLGRAVKRITYDSNGRVVRQGFADGGAETYAYELSGQLVTATTITDPLGRKEVRRFNAAGYLVGRMDAAGQASRSERAIGTNLPLSTSGPCGCAEATRQFDARGNLVAITDRAGKSARLEYDAAGRRLTKVTDKLGHSASMGYDPSGNLTSVTNALNQTIAFAYDAFGGLTELTDPLGHTTRLEYDAAGNLTARVDALGHRRAMEYDAVGRLTALVDPLGRRYSFGYDALDRLTSVTDPDGAVTRYGYDANGNQTSTTDADGRVWSIGYDVKNRPVSMTDPLGNVTRLRYDAGDQVTTLVSPSGFTTRFTYDARGNLASTTDPLQGTVRFAYDARGNLTSVVDARGKTTTFIYDEQYRLAGRRDPSGRSSNVSRDASGAVTEVIDRLGRIIRVRRDELNRVKEIAYPDAVVTFTYDAAGRPARVDDTQSGFVEWGYDAAGRLSSERTPAGVVSYEYNAADQRISMTAADRPPVGYGYDAAGRLQSITQGSETFTYGYDRLSRRSSLRRPNGVTTSYTYDALDRLERLTHADALGQPLEDYRYAYDPDGRLEAITSLASAPLLPAAKTADPADAANRLTRLGDATYSYDPLGQLTIRHDAQGATAFLWDGRGRLRQATLPDGRTVGYAYDALGRLASRTAGGVTTSFLYDRLNTVLDRGSDGSAVEYLNGPALDEKLRQANAAAGPLYFLRDHLGSAAALSDASGRVVERQQYEPFGAGAGSALTRFGYTGRERDDLTGLLFFRARWYDPAQGRFISEDPAGLGGGLNLYAYAGNRPVSRVDPLGLDWVDSALDGAAQVSAGFGDTVSFGITRKIRQWMGTDVYIDPCSGLYHLGEAGGFAWGVAFSVATAGGGAALRGAATAAGEGAEAAAAAGGAAKTGTALARELGIAGEEAAGITAPKVPIESATGTAKYRIPDELTDTALREIKNVKYQSLTNQLKDFLAYSQKHGLEFILEVRQNTRLSGPLQQLVNSGQITLRRTLP